MPTIKNTKVWNSKYQCLVLEIPTVGTRNTKEWYLEYQPLVLLSLPQIDLYSSKVLLYDSQVDDIAHSIYNFKEQVIQ